MPCHGLFLILTHSLTKVIGPSGWIDGGLVVFFFRSFVGSCADLALPICDAFNHSDLFVGEDSIISRKMWEDLQDL